MINLTAASTGLRAFLSKPHFMDAPVCTGRISVEQCALLYVPVWWYAPVCCFVVGIKATVTLSKSLK
jgi:hypothetical protein